MASRCFRLMGRSWSLLQIATLRNLVIRMSSLPTGSTNVRYALACRRLGIGITREIGRQLRSDGEKEFPDDDIRGLKRLSFTPWLQPGGIGTLLNLETVQT